jgi:tetratricopeptide (TPR) repeat protein
MKYISPHWKGKYGSFLEIGTVLLTNGEYYPALRYLKDARKDNPAGDDALCALGLCYAKLKKMDKSILFINKAADLGSEAAKEYLKKKALFALAVDNIVVIYHTASCTEAVWTTQHFRHCLH